MGWMDAVTERVHSHPWLGVCTKLSSAGGGARQEQEVVPGEIPAGRGGSPVRSQDWAGDPTDPEPVCTQKPPNLEPTSTRWQLLFPDPTSALRPTGPELRGTGGAQGHLRGGENDESESSAEATTVQGACSEPDPAESLSAPRSHSPTRWGLGPNLKKRKQTSERRINFLKVTEMVSHT